jgi:hypothetical protein
LGWSQISGVKSPGTPRARQTASHHSALFITQIVFLSGLGISPASIQYPDVNAGCRQVSELPMNLCRLSSEQDRVSSITRLIAICASSCLLSNASSSPGRAASYPLASARHACASFPLSSCPWACRCDSCWPLKRPILKAPRWLASAALLLSSNPKLISLGPRYVLSFCAAGIGRCEAVAGIYSSSVSLARWL